MLPITTYIYTAAGIAVAGLLLFCGLFIQSCTEKNYKIKQLESNQVASNQIIKDSNVLQSDISASQKRVENLKASNSIQLTEAQFISLSNCEFQHFMDIGYECK